MRILHYSSSLTRSAGGLYYSVSGLAKALRGLGADVAAMGGVDSHFEEDRAIWEGIQLYPYSFPWGGNMFDPRVLRDMRRHKADIIHFHGIWFAGSMYGRLLDTPAVVSPRGMLDPWILARRPAVKRIHAALFERPLLRRARLHALNESERQSALAFMPAIGPRLFVIPNGIPPADRIAGAGARKGTLYVGRLHAKKQVLELVRQWQALPANADDHLTIAGWGDAAYEKMVRAAVENDPRIDFVGPLYGDAKVEALRTSRFFVLPSLSEGLPMAVLEALQYGCIPIITEECNLPELFADRVALRMATDFSDFDDVMTAAAGMSQADSENLSRAGSAYSERYLWSTIATEMLAQYRKSIEREG